MTTATLDRPLAIPAPPGADSPFVAPAPTWVCGECCGILADPDFEVVCQTCGGCGLLPASFLLPRSRSHERRHVRYEPACGRLTVAMATKSHTKEAVASYTVTEFETDWKGRAFFVEKRGTDRAHQLFLGATEVRCSCEGDTYLSAAKANQDAWDAGQETYPTFGCIHADAVAALVLAGWFDV